MGGARQLFYTERASELARGILALMKPKNYCGVYNFKKYVTSNLALRAILVAAQRLTNNVPLRGSEGQIFIVLNVS